MSGIIGKKIGMTSLFTKEGYNTPCTVIEAGPCTVLQIKTIKKDGYNAIQLGFDNQNKKTIKKPILGHFKKAKSYPKKKIVEFKNKFIKKLLLGDEVNLDIFYEGQYVDVSSISKGKGFQGVVKRHGFSGVMQASHGQHNRLRAPGSIGAGTDPSRVFKGIRMAGRMGNKKVTIKNLKILKIDKNKNIIVLKGSIPGPKNRYVIINQWK